VKTYRNKKNGKTYFVVSKATNATNAQAGQKMILYCISGEKEFFAREETEFYEKFEEIGNDKINLD
jgi:hypothetical protein